MLFRIKIGLLVHFVSLESQQAAPIQWEMVDILIFVLFVHSQSRGVDMKVLNNLFSFGYLPNLG